MNSIRNAECCRPKGSRWIGDPGFHVGSRDTQESALRVQPVGRQVVFDDPVNGVAG